MTPWTYEGYWNAVLGLENAAGVLREYELTDGSERGLDEWLGVAESAAWNAGGGSARDLPEEWAAHHTRALAALVAAAEERAAEEETAS
jgi:hypothetical protein